VLSVGYYSYWSGIPVTEAQWLVRPGNGFGAFPTNDGLTMLIAAWPHSELATVRRDVEGTYERAIADAFGDRLAGAHREERIRAGGVANRFRVPYGPGWALVGDAGYLRDPVTAQGMTDAFLDAELCAAAVDDALSGVRPFAEAMADYQRRRDARVDGMYELTAQLADLSQPAPPELQQLVAQIEGDQTAMDAFVGVIAGTAPLDELWADEKMG
jgi:2-polyprenyl-6-methoxyphenol hydroxylase-like FAD-dependent oxidoreductase